MIYHNHYIDGMRLLESLGIKGRPSGSNLNTTCPMHHDNHPSFSINLERGVYNCFSKCGGGTIDQLVQQILGCSYLEAHRYILDFSETHAISFNKILEDKPKVVEIMDSGVLIFDAWGPGWWRDRGFDEEDIWNWNIQYEPSTNAMVIPVADGFIKRYPPESLMRYQYSEGLPKKSILFGYDRLLEKIGKIDHILLTEGSLDAIWGVKYGYDTVAILGSSISKEQIKKLAWLNPKEVVLAFDNDKAGWNAAVQATKLMKDKFHLSYLKIPNGKNDLQQLTKEELDKAFKDRTDVLIMQLFNMGPWSSPHYEYRS